MTQHKQILLVEDYEGFRFSLRQLLELEGYQVVEAVDGESAVAQAEQSAPDLILMDLSLPGIDGLEATRRIRQIEQLKGVPIVALSAHDTHDMQADVTAAGFNGYLSKPVDFDQLDQIIKQYLA